MTLLAKLKDTVECISENLEEYSSDYSGYIKYKPIAVVFPKSHIECRDVINILNEYKVPLTIRGAGSGTTGGAIPLEGYVVCSLEKMNKIIDFDIKNTMIVTEPGVILKDIQDLVEKKSLFYPLDPASLSFCTIGGNIAENAGGARALKYGVTKDYVIGLKGIWGNGEEFDLGGKQIKNVVGYDLIHLLVGSEGTLGLITEITLKLIPKPKYVKEAMAIFADLNKAAEVLVEIKQLGIQPSTAEYMTDFCVESSLKYLNIARRFNKGKAYIIWQVDGNTYESVTKQIEEIENVCKLNGMSDWYLMDDNEKSDYIWSIRRTVSLGLKQIAGKKMSEDVVVPPSEVPNYLESLESINHTSGIKVLGYGHLGDGNIHVNILKMNADEDTWQSKKDEVVKVVMEKAVSLGGTISGEHGIGITKKQYMSLVFNSTEIEIMKKIKSVIDPNNILNPGKIFD